MYLNYKLKRKISAVYSKVQCYILTDNIQTYIHVNRNVIPVRRYTEKLLCMYT